MLILVVLKLGFNSHPKEYMCNGQSKIQTVTHVHPQALHIGALHVLALLTSLMGAKGPVPQESPTNGKVLSVVEEEASTS